MMKALPFSLALALLAACGGKKEEAAPVAAPVAAAASDDGLAAVADVTPTDYAKPENWLCRPEVQDACEADASASVVAANGKVTVEKFAPDKDAPIDCFYVYPTVSRDETPNSDLVPGDEEKRSAQLQAARFGSVCRIYAPLYRQTTLTALRAILRGEDAATNREMAYADIKAAWTHYMANDNAGRGVVLIGHDQGAGLLTRLIANEIDGKPAMDKLVVAVLVGSNVETPAAPGPNGSVGGSFKEIGPCVSDEDVGCFIAYSAFRADAPPPENSLFGRTKEQGMQVACVNPAMLDQSNGALKAYLPSTKVTDYGAEPLPWAKDAQVTTPFVAVPGLLSAQCVNSAGASYLAVTLNADPLDARTDQIVGDVVGQGGAPQPQWGLHLIGPNLALGNLVADVKQLAKAYASREISRNQHPREDP